MKDRSIVHHAPFVGAPYDVGHAIQRKSGDIARHHAIEHDPGVGAFHVVLLHRANVISCTAITHTEIFVLSVIVILGELITVPR